jgi:hypothetical protein
MITPAIELKRHREKLSPEMTDEAVKAMADLIVNYLNGKEAYEGNEHPED